MFESLDNNRIMIIGAYKKLKSYYYYDKTALYNKMRLSTWEYPINDMNNRINDLANFMCSLETEVDSSYLSMLLKQISFIPFPKSFEEVADSAELLQNAVSTNKKLSKINFYIMAPVELLILDTIWTLMISKIAYDQACISSNVYANRIQTEQVFNSKSDLFRGIDFYSNRFFYPYFRQYSFWRDNAFKNIHNRYNCQQDSILISLDIKSYYYSVIFEFDHLLYYLKEDKRLNNIKQLTNVIKNIHVIYTAEMQKFRGNIPADCKKEQSALPIGLFSSMILANLYLKDFDNAIITKIAPSYYGRYVDDILIVINKTNDMEISQQNIIEKVFIKNDIIESRKDTYKILLPQGELALQKDKIRCIYFDHTESDALIKLLCETSNVTPSMVSISDGFLLPDIDLSKRNFDEYAYSVGQGNGALKVRNLQFSTNNYKASLFLNDLIRASKNVNTTEINHCNYMESQFKQIIRFYSSQQAIEFRSAWTNVFNLILINERYDLFLEFYEQIYKSINLISSDSVENIAPARIEPILKKLKNALHEQLAISASIALAPYALKTVSTYISVDPAIQKNKAFMTDANTVFENARDIRNANMFNNHMLAYPLLSYISDISVNVSLVNINPSNIRSLLISKSFDDNKIKFAPRFIHLDELYLWRFMVSFSNGGNPFCGKIKENNDQFIKINNIEAALDTIREIENPANNDNYLQYIAINDVNGKRKAFKAALASIFIDEASDVTPVLENPNYNLSPQKKCELYRMLNDAKSKNADIIVFPEFFMPIQWLQEILIFARKNHIAILSGLRYLVSDKQAYNYVVVLQPFSANGFRFSIPLFREKNYYAPKEKIALSKKQLQCKDPENRSTQIIDWNGLRYSNLMCYELTNIEYRYKLRGLIDLLIVLELNRDTNYFSNMVEATTRDLHIFVIQVNTSKYGDSRITGPYNSLFKDIIKLKGGEDDIILTGSIDVTELWDNRSKYQQKLQEEIDNAFAGKLKENETDKRKPKDPVAGFQKEVLN